MLSRYGENSPALRVLHLFFKQEKHVAARGDVQPCKVALGVDAPANPCLGRAPILEKRGSVGSVAHSRRGNG